MARNKKTCEKCSRAISLSNFARHIAVCTGPIKKKIRGIDYDPNAGYISGSRTAWNKGLTKDTDERVKQYALTISEKYKSGEIERLPLTDEQRAGLSDRAKKNELGGYRPHPNKGSNYNGIWFDSNWEVQVAKSLDTADIKWSRPKVGFVWNDNGNKYYPDFYLEEYDVYLDPKNSYLMKKDHVKVSEAQTRNNIRVIVLSEEQLDWAVIKTLL